MRTDPSSEVLTSETLTQTLDSSQPPADRALLNRLRSLFEVERELSRCQSFDELCRRAIELGRSRLGFDRLGLWFFSDDLTELRGSFGTDELGNIRDERHRHIPHKVLDQSAPFLEYKEPLIFVENVPLNNDLHQPVSTGERAMAALWDGENVSGILSTDNLLTHQPITEVQREVLVLYAAAIGNLCKQKAAEAALRESEARNSAMIHAQPDLMFLMNRDGVYLDFHAPSADQLYVSPEHFLGRNMNEIMPDDIRIRCQAAMDLALSTRQTQSLDYELTIDGRQYWFEARIVAFDDDRILAIARDITIAKRQADLLEETGAAAQVGGWELNLRSNNLYWTPEIYRIHETCAEEYCPTADSVSRFYLPETIEMMRETVRECLKTGKGFDVELEMMTCKGNRIWVRSIGRVQMNDGKPIRLYGALQNITERKRLQEELLQAQKVESIGRLAGGIAHDFNNLLTAILGYTELAVDCVEPSSRMEEYLRHVRSAGERAALLTSQLLAFARKQMISPKVANLNDLILDISVILRRLIGEHIELVNLQEPNLGLVKIDEGQFQQILINLVVNARDAMPHGGAITIATSTVTLTDADPRLVRDASPGDYVLLTVSDTGYGIEEKVQRHLFEPFVTTKEPGKGTGLGLATCHGIVKQNGGWIEVSSQVGVGTTFQIYLPRVNEIQPPDPRPQSDGPKQGTETVLVAEDDHALREFVAATLEAHGYAVMRASNGYDALAKAASHEGHIHLLVADVVMPQMGGIALAGELKSRRPDVAVLYFSGYTEDRFIRRGVLESNIRFLQKPFTTDALLRAVRAALDCVEPDLVDVNS